MRIISDNKIDKIMLKIFKECLFFSGQKYNKLELGLSFVDTNVIKKYNKETRGIDKATDVLSFPTLINQQEKQINPENYPNDTYPGDKYINLGDIVICKDIALMQANEYEHSYERELYYLFTHGICHLLGYDHESDKDKIQMRKIEESVLNKLNIIR